MKKYSAQFAWRKRNPWVRYVEYAQRRCTDPNYKSAKNYVAVTCDLSNDEAKIMWHRDGAAQMTKPSIDRKDATKNYTFTNCRFMEHKLNSRRAWDPAADIVAGIEEAPSFA